MAEPDTTGPLADEFKRLVDRSLQANTQLLARAGGVLKDAAQAARDPQRLRGKDARALFGDLLRLQLDYLGVLSRSSTQYLGAVVALAEGAVAAPAAPTVTTAAHATALVGSVGQTLAFRFQLDNPNSEPVSAAVEADPWQGRDGSHVAADALHFEPSATVVPASSQCTVLGHLHIDDRFVVGQTYDTVIRVAGFPGHQVSLSLTVADA